MAYKGYTPDCERLDDRSPQNRSIQTQQRPEHLEFLDQFQGTLPEEIRETDLATINPALALLFSRLSQARALFAQGHRDGGREGAFVALGAVWQFLVLFRAPLRATLHFPILQLMDALQGLDNGLVQPIVRPNRRSGRAPSSHAYLSLKGHAARTARYLMRLGLPEVDAHEAVARELRKIGVRTARRSGVISETTIRNWCTEVSSDVGARSTAGMMFNSFSPEEEQRLLAMPKHQAEQFLLGSLRNWAWLFPEWAPLQDWRRSHPDLPSLTGAVRQLVERGLHSEGHCARRNPRSAPAEIGASAV